jgi:dephospho-CoA kinase
VVDSIRNPSEVAVLRELPGFVLIGIDASRETRFQRSLGRRRPGDPESLGEFEERERQENSADPESQQLDATLALADHLLQNDGVLEDLRAAVDALLERLDRDATG